MDMRTMRRRILGTGGLVAAAGAVPAWLAGCATAGGPALDPAQTAEMTSPELLAALRERRITAEALVGAALDRAERLKDLNAFITLDRGGALTAARRIDADRAAGRPMPPLAGLPIVVKDNIDTAHLATTGGTPALHHSHPARNAPVLQTLLDAGVVVIGKTNLHELAFGITSSNATPFAGPVRNPYDRQRIPGGSSGGTAVAIAARIVPSGLGTDTGGSTRVPAALCGIVGLRPSVGNGGSERHYDGRGVVPISRTRDTIGPMGRSVADVALLDAVVRGRSPDRTVAASELVGLRIGIPAAFWAGLDPDVAAVAAAARDRLAARGVTFVEADLPTLFDLGAKASFPIALHEPIADIPAYLRASGITGITLQDIAAKVASADVKGAFGAIMSDAAGPGYEPAMRVVRPQMQQLYAEYFRANRVDAMLFPTTVAPAIAIDAAAGSGKFRLNGQEVDTFGTFIRNTDPGSVAGIPGLALPAGMTRGGLPVGIELDGPLGSDDRLLAIGLAFEAVLGRLPPPAP